MAIMQKILYFRKFAVLTALLHAEKKQELMFLHDL